MKKILLIAILTLTLNSYAGDSTRVTVTLQNRDWQYIGNFVANSPVFEEVYDSLKVKYRPTPPAALTTNVPITGFTLDFKAIFKKISRDAIAIHSNTFSRMKTALNAIGDSTITAYVTEIDAINASDFDYFKALGKAKLRRVRE